MPTPPIIDVEELLVPIDEANPSGRNLAYEPEFGAIREARRADDDSPQGEWQRKVKVAEWDLVVELSRECLLTKTKDLQIAAWMTEALTRLSGFAGLRDGLGLLLGIQDRFWETFYPEIDEGDLEPRAGPHLFLNRFLGPLIREVPLTAGIEGQRYGHFHWQESRATENAGLKDPELKEALIARGKLDGKKFDDAVAQTPRRFYEALVDDLKLGLEVFKEFDRNTDERFGRDAPTLSNVRKALDECLKLVEPILQIKRREEPDPELDGIVADDALGSGSEAPAAGVSRAAGGAGGSDLGRLLIAFRDQAQALAEAGHRLVENRQKAAELQAQVRALDDEYHEVSRLIGRDEESSRLLSRLLELSGRAPAPGPTVDEAP